MKEQPGCRDDRVEDERGRERRRKRRQEGRGRSRARGEGQNNAGRRMVKRKIGKELDEKEVGCRGTLRAEEGGQE